VKHIRVGQTKTDSLRALIDALVVLVVELCLRDNEDSILHRDYLVVLKFYLLDRLGIDFAEPDTEVDNAVVQGEVSSQEDVVADAAETKHGVVCAGDNDDLGSRDGCDEPKLHSLTADRLGLGRRR